MDAGEELSRCYGSCDVHCSRCQIQVVVININKWTRVTAALHTVPSKQNEVFSVGVDLTASQELYYESLKTK